ncbi:hydroxyisourate hydrolase [Pandoraea commovens]|uniref:5-hydroxyisourate hydrolase n=1 Tax=Pandoraea commovens TaxID=2508289 RepID=A0ABY5QK71_9BURK|nr:hydroxyisourate hydrolase [Pandoraea commovens]UVA80548.1 hydroxyisourate hydrolase [Pandoraea commovens]
MLKKCIFVVLAFCLLPVRVAMADVNPISVHILDQQTGKPPVGVAVVLERMHGESWQKIASGETDAHGRIKSLFPKGERFTKGEYRVIFKTGEYFGKMKQDTFFPEIPVLFRVVDATQHYHIPLLLSQYGYSTYRGN